MTISNLCIGLGYSVIMEDNFLIFTDNIKTQGAFSLTSSFPFIPNSQMTIENNAAQQWCNGIILKADFTDVNANKCCWFVGFFFSKQCTNLPPSTISKGKLLGLVVDVITVSLANMCVEIWWVIYKGLQCKYWWANCSAKLLSIHILYVWTRNLKSLANNETFWIRKDTFCGLQACGCSSPREAVSKCQDS